MAASKRFAGRVLDQHRSTQRKIPAEDEAALTADIIALANQYGHYGYRRIAALLRNAAEVGCERHMCRTNLAGEGLKVPQTQPKKGRLWLDDGSCIRLRPEYPAHLWSYDFVEDGTYHRMLNIIDEFTRECLAVRISRKLKGADVIDALLDLFVLRGIQDTFALSPEFASSSDCAAPRKWAHGAIHAQVPSALSRTPPRAPVTKINHQWTNGQVERMNRASHSTRSSKCRD